MPASDSPLSFTCAISLELPSSSILLGTGNIQCVSNFFRLMSLEALILSSDPELVGVFRHVMEGAGLTIESSQTLDHSLARLAIHRFDAVVVDCADTPQNASIIDAMRKGKSNKTSITYAVLGAKSSMREVYDQGVTFVLHKPLSIESVMRCMRASHGLIQRERRRYFRHPVDTHAHLTVGKEPEIQVVATDISEGGVALNLPYRNRIAGEVSIRLMLPEIKFMVEAKGEVMWCKPDGKAGIKFGAMASASKKELCDWLNSRADLAGLARTFGKAKKSSIS